MLGIWAEVLLDGELLRSGELGDFGVALLAVQPSLDHWASPDPGRLLAAFACVRASPGYQRKGFGSARSGAVESCGKELSASTRAVPLPQLDKEQDTQPSWFAHP